MKSKTPWPTKAVMTQIYEHNFWGKDDSSEFYSGEGSHDAAIVNPYVNAVREFFEAYDKQLTVLDLGCGDFNVGRQLVHYTKQYYAVDIVDALIERNKKVFQQKNLSFLCLDASRDDLPKTDLVILRQVLQHLSNNEILNILSKLTPYKYLMLTEHLPIGDFKANKDIIASRGNRLRQDSGVDVLQPPFNLKVKHSKVLNEAVLTAPESRITTTLFQLA